MTTKLPSRASFKAAFLRGVLQEERKAGDTGFGVGHSCKKTVRSPLPAGQGAFICPGGQVRPNDGIHLPHPGDVIVEGEA